MSVLDTNEANRLLEAITGRATYPATTGPLKMRLNTAVGSDSAAGTEVGASGGYTAGGQAVGLAGSGAGAGWNAAASRQITNAVTVSYTNMPAATVTSVDFYDSAGTPVRKLYGALGSSKVVAVGDTLSFAAGSITVGFQPG